MLPSRNVPTRQNLVPADLIFSAPIALHCTTLHCTVLYCTVLHCTTLHCTALLCALLHCTTLHCTLLYCTTLWCITLHCIAACHPLTRRVVTASSGPLGVFWRNLSTTIDELEQSRAWLALWNSMNVKECSPMLQSSTICQYFSEKM